jgi:predicted nucleic acid-binding Zn ribbon protein
VVLRTQRSLAPPTLLASVQQEWRAAVGDSIADNAQPASERNGVVTVRCDSSVWAAELTMLAASLCSTLDEALGQERRVRGLKFVVDPS